MEQAQSEPAEEEVVAPEMPTEWVISVAGRFFVNADGVEPSKYSHRETFQGVALNEEEEREVRADLDRLLRTARGCDGSLYASVEGMPPEAIVGREVFHGFAMTDEENELAWQELFRMAFNVTVGVQTALGARKGHAET